MGRRHASTVAMGVLLLVGTEPADAETFSLSYQEHAACPSRLSLLEQVAARSARAERVDSGARFRFEIWLDVREDGKVLGTLRVRTPTGTLSTRSVDGANCGEVLSALGLIIALTVDPEARVEPLEAQVLSPSPEANQGKSPPGAAARPDQPDDSARPMPSSQQPALPAHAGTAHPVDSPTPGAALPAYPRDAPPHAAPPHLGIGVQAEWSSLLARGGGAVLLGAHVEWRTRRGPSLGLAGVIGPTVRRDDGHGVSVASSYYGGGIEFGWQVAGSSRAGVDVLGAVWGGGLHSEGIQRGRVAKPGESTTAWFAVGPGLRSRWSTGRFGFAVELAVPFSVVRPRLVLDVPGGTRESFHAVPVAGVSFGLRASVCSSGCATDQNRASRR